MSQFLNKKGTTGRMVFKSFFWEDNPETGKRTFYSSFYMKPKVEGEINGKLAKKWAKRQKVKDMKHANHHKGNNTPWVDR